jgi:hypothetical protein
LTRSGLRVVLAVGVEVAGAVAELLGFFDFAALVEEAGSGVAARVVPDEGEGEVGVPGREVGHDLPALPKIAIKTGPVTSWFSKSRAASRARDPVRTS